MRTCRGCGFTENKTVKLTDYISVLLPDSTFNSAYNKTSVEDWLMCDICARTRVGSLAEHPRQQDDVYRTQQLLVFCTNTILTALSPKTEVKNV